jgi:protocatechuate 3,4-dioxygenase beta subunit
MNPHSHHLDDHDLGLQNDLRVVSQRMAERRRLLGYMVGGGALAILSGCTGEDDGSTSGSGSGSGSGTGGGSTSSSCVAHSQETAGPYPSDGSNSVGGSVSNVLIQSGVVRSDIRSSFGISSNVAGGVPTTLNITVVDSNNSCAALAGYAVYLWHCTREGAYSLYSSGVLGENFLRGVQVADANGRLSFTTIFPGCYQGRYPHIHFEVYRSLAATTTYANRILTSQMALPANICSSVYSTATGYGASANAFAGVSLATDGIFADNTAAQLAAQTPSLSGDVSSGFTGSITIGVG